MTEPPGAVYANVVEITTGPFDMVFDFGFRPPESSKRGSTEFAIVARVAMSLAHAKTLLPILSKQIAEYEQRVGPITAPGFDEFSSS
jgi:hypothetical protein